MRKKFVYMGLALIALFIVMLLVAVYATSNIGGKVAIMNVTAGKDSINYVPIYQPSNTFTVIYVLANNATNIYVLNSSVFDGLASYVGSNTLRSGYRYILDSNVNKSYVFHDNTTAIAYTTPNYNNISKSGQFYVVIDNTNDSASSSNSVFASVLYKPYQYSEGLGYLAIFVLTFMFLIAGIGLIAYGIFKNEKPIVEEPEPQHHVSSTKSAKKKASKSKSDSS